MADLASLPAGERVRVLGGRNFEKFHGGMEGTIVENSPDSRNMRVQFDDATTSGSDPIVVAYRHLEHATNQGGYRHVKKEDIKVEKTESSALLKEHGSFKSKQLVRLHGLQNAAELNGRIGRLQRFDSTADRWEVEVRGEGQPPMDWGSMQGQGRKRLKEDNLQVPQKPEVPAGLSVPQLKERGNESFKASELEEAIACYSAAIDLLEDAAEGSLPPEVEDPKYAAVLLNNRAQCFIMLCREIHGEDASIGQEARNYAMRANMDAAKAIEMDPTSGKAYYRRGCAVLGMAPSASRAKEAISHLEVALAGRASGGKDGVVLPNAMRHEVSNLLDYAKRRLDACTEAAVPDVEQCRENCRQQ
ncbi:Protein unc-45 homolog B (Unc-45B) (UNC45-related protein) [Durusdinium trenchii]|uniref:Protein unc-45 homolog B (Unc-45B) (UNC45-related protein) n=1 Tax=Durusdinium trenchii TaxID=1381693 RepID=A0ABP0LXS1_9DINO